MTHEAQIEKSLIDILTMRENQWTYRGDIKQRIPFGKTCADISTESILRSWKEYLLLITSLNELSPAKCLGEGV